MPFLSGERIYLRPLVESDARGACLIWLNDEEVCRWNRHCVVTYTFDDALAYVNSSNGETGRLALAIVSRKDDLHIGNISLEGINSTNRTGELTIIIGEKSFWRKGYGGEAARLLCEHAFVAMKMVRVSCGTFEGNTSMRRLAESLGMVEEGRRRRAVYKHGRHHDVIEYGLLRDEFFRRLKKHG